MMRTQNDGYKGGINDDICGYKIFIDEVINIKKNYLLTIGEEKKTE